MQIRFLEAFSNEPNSIGIPAVRACEIDPPPLRPWVLAGRRWLCHVLYDTDHMLSFRYRLSRLLQGQQDPGKGERVKREVERGGGAGENRSLGSLVACPALMRHTHLAMAQRLGCLDDLRPGFH